MYVSRIQYLRLTDDSIMREVQYLMTALWRMTSPTRPDLIVSVIGADGDMTIAKAKKRSLFNNGLIRVGVVILAVFGGLIIPCKESDTIV